MTKTVNFESLRVLYKGTGTKRHFAAAGETQTLCGIHIRSDSGTIHNRTATCSKCLTLAGPELLIDALR